MPYVHQPVREGSNRSRSIFDSYGTQAPTRRAAGGVGGGMGLAGAPARPQAGPAPQRGFPERVEADLMGVIQTAAMAPGHTLERPVAIAGSAARFLTGTPQGEKGPLDGLLEGIGNIGIGEFNVGNALDAIGSGIISISDAPIALANAGEANLIRQYARASDSDIIDPVYNRRVGGLPFLGMMGLGGREMTVGEWRAELMDRGFNLEYNDDGTVTELTWEEVVQKANENPFGFGTARVNESHLTDIATRIVADPLNLLLGAGMIGKAGQVARWSMAPVGRGARAATSALRPSWGVGYMADMQRMGIRAGRLPSPSVAGGAIAAGNTRMATLPGLGNFLGRAVRGAVLPGQGSVARRYARGALRLELGLLGVEYGAGALDAGVSGVLGEDNVVSSGFLEPVHDAAQAFLGDKPMSENVTFMMASAFAMPAVPLLREDLGSMRARARESFGDQDLFLWSQKYGSEDPSLSIRNDPMGRRRGRAREDSFLERVGGPIEFAALIDHVDLRIAFDRLRAYKPVLAHFASFDEAMARSQAIGHMLATEAARLRAAGKIKPRDRMESFEEWGRSHSRTVQTRDGAIIRDLPERVDFELSPDELIGQWTRYRAINKQLSENFQPVGEAITGRAQRLTQEDLAIVRAVITNAAENGKVSSQLVRDLLNRTPAMFEDLSLSPESREFWTTRMNLGVGGDSLSGRGTFDLAELDRELQILEEHAPRSVELFHEAGYAESQAPSDPSRPDNGVLSDGVRRIYSERQLRDLRTSQNGTIRGLTKEIASAREALGRKWTNRGNLRLRRKVVRQPTKPEVSPMGGIDELRSVARGYNESTGLKPLKEREYWAGDPDFGRRTGLAYEAMAAVDDSPATRLAYEAFVDETLAQYQALLDNGYRMEPWTDELAAAKGAEQPYETSVEMQADVRQNKHLYFFTGGEPHPFMGTPLPEHAGLTANDIFRAVHDIMTHAQEGYQFGARGELNAAIKHSQMYSPIARRAMLTETHGQNSWTNYGPHNPQALPATDRPYAAQKAALLPDEIIEEFEGRFIGETEAVASRKAREIAEALGLDAAQANAAGALLEARARAWASAKGGRSAAEYLRRFTFEKGGEVADEALLQSMIRATTAFTKYPAKRGPREGTAHARRLEAAAKRLAKRDAGILPSPDTAAGRRKAHELLPDTDEVRWLKEVALTEVLSPEGAGPYYAELQEFKDTFYRAVYREQQRQLRSTGTLSDDVLFQTANQLDTASDTGVSGSTEIGDLALPGRDRGILEPLLNQPAPAELVEAGLGDASELVWFTDRVGNEFAIPGGLEGTFSLWDAWRLKAQQIDPNYIPEDVRIGLYTKLFESQARALTNPVDSWNRIVLAHMSPNLSILKNEQALAALRIRSVEDLAALLEGGQEAAYQRIAQAGAAGKTTGPQLRSLLANAERFLEQPDWFTLFDGEDLISYSERVMSVLDGAGMKVGNFSAMLGDPLGHNRGTIDSHMVDILAREGYLPEDVAARLNGQAPSAKAVSLQVRGKPNPNVPEHLRELPWVRKDGKVMTFDGDYRAASEGLDRYLHDRYPDLPFHSGGGQWFLWDMERGVIEPHTTIWPGAEALPNMEPAAIRAAGKVAKEAGYFKRTAGVPYDPAAGIFYQEGQSRIKGATEFVDDGKVIIRGLNSPDISTFVHEVGHVFRRDLDGMDLDTVETHYGVVEGTWTREAEEAFAQDFERWTRNNKSTPAQLQRIFAQLYEWMRQVYRSVLKKDVDAEIGQVFRNLFEEKERPLQLQTHGFNSRISDNLDIAVKATGEPNTVGIVVDEMVGGSTRYVTLSKFGADGTTEAMLNIIFDPETGLAAKDGLNILTKQTARGKGHASDLYAFAEQQGWEVEQASARSTTLTAAGREFQKRRWANQRAIEQEQINLKVERARELRREVRETNKRLEELRTVRVDPSFLDENGNPTVSPESLQAIREQTAYVQDNFPRQYGIEKAPTISWARYQPEDSHLAALLTERSNLAQVLFDYGPIAKMTQFIDAITRPVKADKMAHDARQQVYNLLLPLGAKSTEVSTFLDNLRDKQNEGLTVGPMHAPLFRGVTGLPPNSISVEAAKAFAGNATFTQRFAQKYGGMDRMHVMLDEAHNSLVRKIDLKTMRGQKNGRLERAFRSGYWAWQHLPGLRTLSDTSRMASKVFYPIFRFQLDVRWQALNLIEADTLAFFRDGINGTRFSRQSDNLVRRGGEEINLSRQAADFHGEQSGIPTIGGSWLADAAYEDAGIFLTNQNLAPVLRRSFDIQRGETVAKTIDDLADTDPVLQLLRRKYGDNQGTWAEQLDADLYAFDRKGVKETIDEAVRNVGKDDNWSQAEYDQMVPFINKLIERNQQTFDDLVQIHVGNINRSRLERTLNSFWLFWPLSYQIKATKWMVGVLSQRAFGQNTNLGGAFMLDRAAQTVRDQVANDPGFAEWFEDNEDWWFAASMVLPIAPWDWGVAANRYVRYVGGNVLGLWPEYAGLDGPGDWIAKGIEMGPVYTIELLQRLFPGEDSAGSRADRSVTSVAP